MKSNLKIYKLHKIFFLSMLIDPIFVLYATSAGISPAQLFIMTSIQMVAIILLELPTGILSDLYGCKVSILLGTLAFILSNIIYLFSKSFKGFLIGEIIVAFYKVFISGSDEAYLFLELKRNHREDNYAKVSGWIDSVNYMMTAISSIVMGYVYILNAKSPFIISIILGCISLLFALKLENLREANKEVVKLGETYKAFINTALAGFKLILTDKKIGWFISYSAVISFALVAMMNTYPFYFMKLEIEPQHFGWLYFFLYIVSAIASKYAYQFKKDNIYKVFMGLLGLLMMTPLMMMMPHSIFLIVIIIPRLVIGVYPALIREFINKELPINRATIFSIRSLLMRGVQVLLLPVVGVVIEHYGLNDALGVILCVIGLLFVILRLYLKVQNICYNKK